MKRIAFASTVVASLLAASAASAEIVPVTDDTYILHGSKKGYGTSTSVHVSKTSDGDGDKTRKAIFEFTSQTSRDVRTATLLLDVTAFDDPGSLTSALFYVWGVRDAASGCGESFDDGSAKKGTFPFLDGSTDGVANESSCLYDADPSASGAQMLGTFTVHKSDVGSTVTFSSQALVDFINTDTNGKITLAITAGTNSGSLVTSFASREHPTRSPARLEVTRIGTLYLDDSGAFDGALTMTSATSAHFEGDLRIPITGGAEVLVPGASVDMTFDDSGEVVGVSGPVGVPEVPRTGLFESLCNVSISAGFCGMSSGGPGMEIGYAKPSEFDTLGLPLDKNTPYFYFLNQSGVSYEWGPLTVSSPNAGATLLAIDPDAPAVFFFTDELLPESQITSVSVGVSGANTIPFDPDYSDEAVESYLTPFDGDAYVGGTLAIPTKIPGVDVVVDANVTADVEDTKFANGDVTDWVRRAGANGDVFLEAGTDVITLSFYMGGGSLRYENTDSEWVAFSGVAAPEDLSLLLFGGAPLTLGGQIGVAGYLHEDASKSFVDLDGEMKFGDAFLEQKIEGRIHVDAYGAELDGKATFAGTTIKVSGDIHEDYAKFSGSLSTGFSVPGGSVKATVKATFDSRDTEVDLDASAKFCFIVKQKMPDPIPDVKVEECNSVGASASLTGDGRIRICARIGGKDECQTLN